MVFRGKIEEDSLTCFLIQSYGFMMPISSFEENNSNPTGDVLHDFEEVYKEELTNVTEVLAKLTHRPFEQVKSHLELMLAHLIASREEKAFSPDRSQILQDRVRPFDPVQWQADLKTLGERAENIPVLPPEAFTRESIYKDRD
jgi:hypothetical protein